MKCLYAQVYKYLESPGKSPCRVLAAFEDSACNNAFFRACSAGLTDVVEMLLDLFDWMIKDQSEEGGTKLVICKRAIKCGMSNAARHGHISVVRMLLKFESSVYEDQRFVLSDSVWLNRSNGGLHGDALKVAAESGHVDIVRVLLDRRHLHRIAIYDNVDMRDDGEALSLAAMNGHETVVRAILDAFRGKCCCCESSRNSRQLPCYHRWAREMAAGNNHGTIVRLLEETRGWPRYDLRRGGPV
jgi:ankyrin repeat protein